MIEFTFWESWGIILGFSILVIVLDEFVVKPMRHRRWEQKAASGDPEAHELLRKARNAKVSEE
jgi:hypothetical protein